MFGVSTVTFINSRLYTLLLNIFLFSCSTSVLTPAVALLLEVFILLAFHLMGQIFFFSWSSFLKFLKNNFVFLYKSQIWSFLSVTTVWSCFGLPIQWFCLVTKRNFVHFFLVPVWNFHPVALTSFAFYIILFQF